LIQKGKIQAISSQETSTNKTKSKKFFVVLAQTISRKRTVAMKLSSLTSTRAPDVPTRTIRRWRNQYSKQRPFTEVATSVYYQTTKEGNYLAKVDEATQAFMMKFIEEHYENLKQRSKLRVYLAFCGSL
jgi:ferritin